MHMTEIGRQSRLDRLGRDGRYVIVPMDHGITIGPVDGLVDIESTVSAVCDHGADAVLTHRGLAERVLPETGDAGYVVHLNASTIRGPDPNDKRPVCTPERAIAAGGDAVSVHVNVGADTEPTQLEVLGEMIESAHQLGLPVLAMMYPRGPDVDASDPETTAHAVRVGAELGADLIKTSMPDGSFTPVAAATTAPVLVAGGEAGDPRPLLERIATAIDQGAAGVSIGRSIFQHPDPGAMAAAVAAIVHEDASVDVALESLEE